MKIHVTVWLSAITVPCCSLARMPVRVDYHHTPWQPKQQECIAHLASLPGNASDCCSKLAGSRTLADRCHALLQRTHRFRISPGAVLFVTLKRGAGERLDEPMDLDGSLP